MKPQFNRGGLRTWVEIDQSKVEHNYRLFRGLLKPETKLMAVAKSNAYGHDIYQFAMLMEKLGADWIGVDSIVEGEALRKSGITAPILVLGYTLPEKFASAVEQNVSLAISTFEGLECLASNPVKFHLKIDTGMHRQGFLPEQVPQVLEKLKTLGVKPEQFEGIFTHFAAAKNPSFPTQTLAQLKKFNEVLELIKQAGYSPIRHAAATSGTIVFPESHFDMVRIGIGMYGLWPSLEVREAFGDKLPLEPILSWRSIVSEVKTIPAGEGVGYDFTEKLAQPGQIAICPIGYWHGFPRALSSIGHALVNGEKVKVLGRVSMDMIILDVSKAKNVKPGDVVTLIGTDGNQSIGATDLALVTDASWYEIVTRLNPLMKRVYVN
jgi:alanine racemase